jgi:hypothetical protein
MLRGVDALMRMVGARNAFPGVGRQDPDSQDV